jgi:hypothetical protein
VRKAEADSSCFGHAEIIVMLILNPEKARMRMKTKMFPRDLFAA